MRSFRFKIAGELSLDGIMLRIPGVLPMALKAPASTGDYEHSGGYDGSRKGAFVNGKVEEGV